jgi:hypothetical protein
MSTIGKSVISAARAIPPASLYLEREYQKAHDSANAIRPSKILNWWA